MTDGRVNARHGGENGRFWNRLSRSRRGHAARSPVRGVDIERRAVEDRRAEPAAMPVVEATNSSLRKKRQVVEIAPSISTSSLMCSTLRGHLGMEQYAALIEPRNQRPEPARGKGEGLSRRDQPDPDPRNAAVMNPLQDRLVRDVRVDDVDLVRGVVVALSWRRSSGGDRWPGTFERTVVGAGNAGSGGNNYTRGAAQQRRVGRRTIVIARAQQEDPLEPGERRPRPGTLRRSVVVVVVLDPLRLT